MKYFICLVFWLLGIFLALSLHYSFLTNNKDTQTHKTKTHITQVRKNINLKIGTYYKRARDLFLHNLFVAFLLSIGGLITAGSLSLIVLSYNGFITTSVIITIYQQDSFLNILSNLTHAPFEIIALIWFGSIGLSGVNLTSNFIKKKQITITDFHTLQNIWKPIILLLIAALIEAN
jgi:uncharacterized membrane protein SpoIIM required for sporulation